MRTVWKWEIPHEGMKRCTVRMPYEGRIIRVGTDGNEIPSLWAEVDTEQDMGAVSLAVVPTGGEIPNGTYLGSFEAVAPIGWTIWHVYETMRIHNSDADG